MLLKREISRLAEGVNTFARRETSSNENKLSGLDKNSRIILTLAEEPKSFSKAVFISQYYHSYLSVTTAPAASSLALSSSAVFLVRAFFDHYRRFVGHILGLLKAQSKSFS